MAKTVLIALVFLAGVIMSHAVDNSSTTASPNNATTAEPVGNQTTAEPTTVATEAPTTAAGAMFQPLAIFVLVSAFLGLLH